MKFNPRTGQVYNPSSRDQEELKVHAQRHFAEPYADYRGAMNVTIEGIFQRPKYHYKRNLRGSDDRLK